jgi:stage II sporulation protein D
VTFFAGLACLYIEMNFRAILAMPFLAALPVNGPDTVSISLFSLFKPETVQVRIASGDGALLDLEGLESYRSITRGELIIIRLAGNRLNIVVAKAGGTIRQSVMTNVATVAPEKSGTMEISVPGKIKRTVRGMLKFDAGAGGHGPLRIMLTTDREFAVASVVAAETSRREPAALMAIAVAVRTFMRSHTGRHSSEGFDFCDTTHCQFYRGEQDFSGRASSPPILEAVARTAGEILSFDGRPIQGYYTAVCGGLSATPSMVWGGRTSYPYVRIVCRWCRDSRFSRWKRSADAHQILDSLASLAPIRFSAAAELFANVDEATGLVRSVTVSEQRQRVVLGTDSFRRAIGRKLGWNTVLSPTFTVERRGTQFIFRGSGFGSQVGLCEEGAAAQAAAGRGYREILSFYYPGAEITERASHE